MEFIHIKDGDYTSEMWFEKLAELERESADGYEITVIRNDDGFCIPLFENGNFVDNVAIFLHIADAYSAARSYLIRHKQTGFYIV